MPVTELCPNHRRSVNLTNLYPLPHTLKLDSEDFTRRMAFINARSLVNKTVELNNFFKSHELDFMLLTET